jgi:hypothetical protein
MLYFSITFTSTYIVVGAESASNGDAALEWAARQTINGMEYGCRGRLDQSLWNFGSLEERYCCALRGLCALVVQSPLWRRNPFAPLLFRVAPRR